MNDLRAYPDRPILAVSAAIIRSGRLLLVLRARPPSAGLFSLPGGAVESGETLTDALKREIREELNLDIEPVALAGYREAIVRDADGRAERHFVILAFAARLVGGEPRRNEEISEIRWVGPAEIAALATTEGLADIASAAFARMAGT